MGTASRKPGNGLRHQGCASRVPGTLNGRPALSCLGALHGGPGARIISRSHPHQGKLPASATQAVNGKVLLFKPGTGGETDPPRESGVTATGGNLAGRDRQGVGRGRANRGFGWFARLTGLRALRLLVRNFFLEGIPDGFVTYVPFFSGRFLASQQKARLAFRNFRSGFRLSTHKSPLA